MRYSLSVPVKRTGKSVIVEGLIKNAWPDALDLHPWRVQGGRLEEVMLRVTLPAGKAPAPNTIVRVTASALVKVKDPNITFQRLCQGARPLKTIKDAELGAIAEARTKPRVYTNRILGTLELDRTYDWYAGAREHGGQSYEILIDVTDPDNEKAAAKQLTAGARAILAAEAKLAAFTKTVVAKMHPLWLSRWRDRQRKYTAEDFARMIELGSIHVQGDRTTLRYRSGSLFSDHGIEVRIKGGKIRECFVA